VKDKGKAFIERLNNLDADEIIFIHDECYSMIKKSREEFGYEVRFKPTHILEHMSNYLKENASKVTKLNKKIGYQRPCSSRVSPETDDLLDEFFELIGVERVSRKYDRKNALCCGGILKSFGQVERGNESQATNLDDAMKHGAEAMVFLCPMCGLALSGICKIKGIRSFFVVDLFRMALGEIQYPG
ncbi:MAG: heterodisulfide reductase-related iron-sulfur binding cluster, partial [Thermodesulfobacteriota bacterium]|nr:heterodisulfide reductase-related iron-sulfur binding cluster [Thermodesulfobacteriota bacterium]